MSNADNHLSLAVGAIQDGAFTQGTLNTLRKAVDDGETALVVSALLANGRVTCRNEEDTVSQSMSKLESLAAIEKPIACILMTELYLTASRLLMHEVCDSIELWIDNCDSAQLTRYLSLTASSQNDPKKRKLHERFLQIRSRWK